MKVSGTAARLIIGTRGSALARWQAEHVAARLREENPGLEVRLEIIVTSGDRFQAGPVSDVGGKAVWVKEIEDALLSGAVDLAVHSLKDVPASLPDSLFLAAFPPRADARDAWLSRAGATLRDLPRGTRVGTSSLRRTCQLRALRPDLQIELFRGNVDTRLRKLDEGFVDAAVLACAGLDRLGYGARITERLEPAVMLPAIGQGCMAIETRQGPSFVNDALAALDDPDSRAAATAERALMAALGGSCRTPVGGHAVVSADTMTLTGLVGRPDGGQVLRVSRSAPRAAAAALGTEVAQALLAEGAADILAALG